MFATPAATPVRGRRLATLVSALTVALLCAGWLAAPAGAMTLPATCGTLLVQLIAANPGDTIVLSGMCTSPNATFTLPAKANLTIEGAPTGTNGFDGTGVSTPALTTGVSGNIDGLTLENLTFQHYASSSAVHLRNITTTGSFPFTFSHDTFTGDGANTQGVPGGGLFLDSEPTTCAFPSSPDVTVTDSTFTNDLADPFGGGAMIKLGCVNAVRQTVSVTGNVFSNDHLTDTMFGGDGGGLYVDGVNTPVSLTQQNNIFESDSVTGAAANLAGGGEYAIGANITSVGDQFIDDSLSGPSTSTTWSWGAGLALLAQACTPVTSPVTSQFTDLVAAGNSIGAPTGSATGADVAGAGIYAGGCFQNSYNLTLINSTVSGNTVSGTGAVAGISGHTFDTLNLQNTIVDGDSGGAELGGFGASTGASVTATDSDVCAVDSTSVAFAGTGNLCAAPALAGAGTGDAHETATSPTIDAGANALVPAGVSTDAYGNPRIVPRVGGGTALVDIGAAELPSTAPPVTTPVNTSPPVVTGTVDVGDTLTCSTGTWTGAPTSFTYTWSRDGTPIAGATHSTYAVQSIDQGRTLTCTVSAANAAGTAAGVASRQVSVAAARCATATGLLHGRRLGLITLGDTRAQAAKGYLHASTRHRRHEEFFCLTPIGVRVGYAAPGALRTLSPHQRAALRGRVIWISTANRFYALDGVRPGATLRAARRRLKLGAVFSRGHNDWYFARGTVANGLIKVRRGIVQEIGIVTKLLTGGRRAQGRFLRSFG